MNEEEQVSDALEPEETVEVTEALPEQEIEALRGELQRAQDRALRLQAELENFRMRTRRELDEERRYASLPLIRDLLPVMDNIERALEAAEKTEGSNSILEGVRLMAQQLQTVLAAHECRVIDALHKPFDPNLHEALMQQPSEEHPPGTVVMATRTGYQLHDRVIRPTQVIVSSAPAS